jgi:uncharacterized DUF497 family protein
VEFEFSKRKSESNKRKHGIDFVDAQALWGDPDRLEVPAKTQPEQRFVLIGKIAEKHWSAVFTTRASKTRIISVRRSRKQEVKAYEG